MSFLRRFADDIALLLVGDIRRGGIGRGYSEGTYVHLGRKAEIRMASDTPSPFPLKSISVIVVVIVTACLSPKVKLDIAPLSHLQEQTNRIQTT
jgi:hypothetical protein